MINTEAYESFDLNAAFNIGTQLIKPSTEEITRNGAKGYQILHLASIGGHRQAQYATGKFF